MDCPACGLLNPPEAQRCDCGYDFHAGRMETTYLTEKDQQRDAEDRKQADTGWSLVKALLWLFKR